MFIGRYTLVPFFLVIISYGFGNTRGYIMPICSNCDTCDGQCSEKNDDDNGLVEVKKTSELFSFVTNTGEVIRNIIYDTVLPVFVRQKPKPRDPSYISSVFTYFGFHVESETADGDEFVICNGSIFALIFVLYFGYLFMATKTVKIPITDLTHDEVKFLRCWENSQDDTREICKEICCHDHEHDHDYDDLDHDHEIQDEEQNLSVVPYELCEAEEK